MNAANLSTLAGQTRHYAEIKKRLYGKPIKLAVIPKPANDERPAPEPVKALPLPLWQQVPTEFNSHMIAFRMWQQFQEYARERQAAKPAEEVIPYPQKTSQRDHGGGAKRPPECYYG